MSEVIEFDDEDVPLVGTLLSYAMGENRPINFFDAMTLEHTPVGKLGYTARGKGNELFVDAVALPRLAKAILNGEIVKDIQTIGFGIDDQGFEYVCKQRGARNQEEFWRLQLPEGREAIEVFATFFNTACQRATAMGLLTETRASHPDRPMA